MNGFSIRRFGQVLRYDFTKSRGNLWKMPLGMTAVLFFFFRLIYDDTTVASGLEYAILMGIVELGSMMIVCAALVIATRLYSDLEKKGPRTIALLLPASNLEKFLSRWVYMLVMTLLCGVVAYVAADLLHAGWLSLTGKKVIMTSGAMLTKFTGAGSARFWVNILAIHSFCLLSSVLFTKFQTVGALVTGMVIFSLFNLVFRQTMTMTSEAIDSLCLVLMPILTIVFTILAYMLFCRWQIVTRKLITV